MNKAEILISIFRMISWMGTIAYVLAYIGKLVNKEPMPTRFLMIIGFWIILTMTLYGVV